MILDLRKHTSFLLGIRHLQHIAVRTRSVCPTSTANLYDFKSNSKINSENLFADRKRYFSTSVANNNEGVSNKKQQKLAMMVAYNGVPYRGFALSWDGQQNLPTISRELTVAFSKAGLIEPINSASERLKASFFHTSRTDRWVSALQQVIALTTDRIITDTKSLKEEINSFLPTDIRIIAVQKPPEKEFHTKEWCYQRTYTCTLPSYVFAHADELVNDDFRLSEDRRHEVNRILMSFRGVRSFHNFTAGKLGYEDGYDCERSISKCVLLPGSFVKDGLEFVTVTVSGTGFLRFQIRMMLGLAIAVVRGVCDKGAIAQAFLPSTFATPRISGTGLVLEESYHYGYAKAFQGKRCPLVWRNCEAELKEFRENRILPAIYDVELNQRIFLKFMETLPCYVYGNTKKKDARMNFTGLGEAYREIRRIKAKEAEAARCRTMFLLNFGSLPNETDELLVLAVLQLLNSMLQQSDHRQLMRSDFEKLSRVRLTSNVLLVLSREVDAEALFSKRHLLDELVNNNNAGANQLGPISLQKVGQKPSLLHRIDGDADAEVDADSDLVEDGTEQPESQKKPVTAVLAGNQAVSRLVIDYAAAAEKQQRKLYFKKLENEKKQRISSNREGTGITSQYSNSSPQRITYQHRSGDSARNDRFGAERSRTDFDSFNQQRNNTYQRGNFWNNGFGNEYYDNNRNRASNAYNTRNQQIFRNNQQQNTFQHRNHSGNELPRFGQQFNRRHDSFSNMRDVNNQQTNTYQQRHSRTAYVGKNDTFIMRNQQHSGRSRALHQSGVEFKENRKRNTTKNYKLADDVEEVELAKLF